MWRGTHGKPGEDAHRQARPQGVCLLTLRAGPPRASPARPEISFSVPAPTGGDCVDPAAPPHFSAADTLSDTLRKMSASKKLWITGSSAKEGRSEGALEPPFWEN